MLREKRDNNDAEGEEEGGAQGKAGLGAQKLRSVVPGKNSPTFLLKKVV